MPYHYNSFPLNANSIYWILIYVFLLGLPYLYYGYVAIKAPSIQNQLNILFNSTILITYATYLSYSRATWLGLTAALGLMFTITIILENKKTTKAFLLATFGCLFLTIFSYLFILFKLYILNDSHLNRIIYLDIY